MMKHLAALSVLCLASCTTSLNGQGGGQDSGDCVGAKCDELQAPPARCSVTVVGHSGSFDAEEEYLPRVLACENPAAPYEALKAQAIAARSYMHYVMGREGRSLEDGETDQVFTCNNPPRDEHRQAVADTAGQILTYKSSVVASFYVAGSRQSVPACDANRFGDPDFDPSLDPTGTERLVTYNEGRSGSDLIQSKQGLRDPSNHANRGTMSQLGANCWAETGKTTDQILRLYYGEDIVVTQTVGECIVPPAGGGGGNNGGSTQSVNTGKVCTEDSQCGATAPSGACKEWLIQSTDEMFGMCMANCNGECGNGEFCAEFEGSGKCMPEPKAANGFCANIPGTTPRILKKPGGSDTASGDWGTVCAPPHVGTSCRAPAGAKGECIDVTVSSCSGGVTISGACPGSGSVQCCLR